MGWLALNRRTPASAPEASGTMHAAARRPLHLLWRMRRAWTLGLFFGIVNGGYTSLVAWLPASINSWR